MSMGDHETESMMSGEGGSSHAAPHTPLDRGSAMMSPEPNARPGMDRLDSVLPDDSASHHGADEVSALTGAVEDAPYTFKFKAPNGRVHRLQVVASAGLATLIADVAEKLGGEVEGLGGTPTFTENQKISHIGFALSYMDNEGDTISITTDHDLLEAITLAQMARKDKVDLFVHHPDQPALPPTTQPQPINPPTPPESHVRHRKKVADSDEEDAEMPIAPKVMRNKADSASSQQEQLVPGVPNDLLLPGGLVVLGVAIVFTFVIARSSR